MVSDALAAAGAALSAPAIALQGQTASPVLLTHTTHSQASHADSPDVRDVVNDFLVAKARAGRSDRYLRQLRVSLSNFSRGRASVPLSAVTLADVEKWIFGQGWEPKTMRGHLSDVRTLFRFAERRGYVRDVKACRVELPESPAGHAPGMHTPEQVRAVLETARRTDLDVCRHLAVRYFTGLRSAEAHRLAESDLLIEQGFVQVSAHFLPVPALPLMKMAW